MVSIIGVCGHRRLLMKSVVELQRQRIEYLEQKLLETSKKLGEVYD